MSKVNWSNLPQAVPGGDIMPHMSARLRRSQADAAFQIMGGVDALVAWAETDRDTRKAFYTQIWSPGQAKASNVEVSASEGVETLLEKLDRAEKATTIDGEYTRTDEAA